MIRWAVLFKKIIIKEPCAIWRPFVYNCFGWQLLSEWDQPMVLFQLSLNCYKMHLSTYPCRLLGMSYHKKFRRCGKFLLLTFLELLIWDSAGRHIRKRNKSLFIDGYICTKPPGLIFPWKNQKIVLNFHKLNDISNKISFYRIWALKEWYYQFFKKWLT